MVCKVVGFKVPGTFGGLKPVVGPLGASVHTQLGRLHSCGPVGPQEGRLSNNGFAPLRR